MVGGPSSAIIVVIWEYWTSKLSGGAILQLLDDKQFVFNSKIFWLRPTIFWDPKFSSDTKFFWDPNFLGIQIVLGHKIFLGLKILLELPLRLLTIVLTPLNHWKLSTLHFTSLCFFTPSHYGTKIRLIYGGGLSILKPWKKSIQTI